MTIDNGSSWGRGSSSGRGPYGTEPPLRAALFQALFVLLTVGPAAAQEVRDEIVADEAWDDAVEAAEVEVLPEDTAEIPEPVEIPDDSREPAALPSGEAKSAVTPQSISLPSGGGSIEGMGESFEAALQSGAATFGVPLAVAPGRNGLQPSLSLSYSSTNGNGVAGIGWGVGVGAIHRQSDRGLPRYIDGPAWHPEEDRFVYGAGQELVPVDTAAAMLVDCGASDCAPIPAELTGWQQYRSQNEGGFHRVFRSPDGTRWVVQAPDGSRSDFGQLPPGDGPAEMVDASVHALVSELPGGAGRIYGWKLTRTVDPNGSVIYYRYFRDGGTSYLQDIHYGSPHAACSGGDVGDRMRCTAPLSDYGQRVRFVYESRDDVTTSFATTWGMTTALRVQRVEMTAAAATIGARYLVRRYHLAYSSAHHHSLLQSVLVEGRPQSLVASVGVMVGDPLVPESALSDDVIGLTSPPMTFEYTEAPSGIAEGFGGISHVVQSAAASPPHSVDEARSDLFDVNSDGLPDLIVTDPARYRTPDGRPAVGVFFNGFSGEDAAPAEVGASFSAAVPVPMPSDLSATMTLSNANIQPMDVDGDGRSDLLHFPRTPDTGYFVAARNDADSVSPADQGWQWVYVQSQLPPGVVDPRIDFQRDGERLRMLDVNNDHLVDIVRTAGDRIQIWLNLGWLPDGDGRFGSYAHVDGEWQLYEAPLERCLPSAGTPVDFGDPETRFADMNGDGVQDLVRVRRGRVIYWPGRGERGFGDFSSCEPGIAGGGYVEMASPPAELHVDGAGVHLSDVNGDGASDVVQIDTRDIHVWLNRSGSGFTRRVTARTDLFAPAFAPRVRLADIDGSGTLDVVFGNANNWRFVDLMDGQRPRMLARVTTGLGGRTEITYGTSTEDYLGDLREAYTCPHCETFTWTTLPDECDQKLLFEAGECVYRAGGSPSIVQVVREVRASDRLDVVGGTATELVTQHAYHDAYYEGFEQELRGFGAADAVAVGGEGHPTGWTRSHFYQGRRAADIASDRLADNPDEPLKGLTYLSESFDEGGTFVGTTHTSFAIRTLHAGLDGRVVRYAYGTQSDELAYDVINWAPGTDTVVLPSVRHEDSTGATTEVWDEVTLGVRGAGWAHMRSTTDVVTNLGHVLRSTAHGRIRGAFGETPPDESIVSERQVANVGDWLFRETRSWMHGHGDPTPLGDTTTTYDARGNAIATSTTITQAQLYEFNGDAEAMGFPMVAPEASIGTTEVDPWGQGLRSCGGGDVSTGAGCLTYSEVQYDAEYAQIPISESTATGRSGGSFTMLTSTGTWDRGLGIATSMSDPNGITSSTTVDGLGRMTAQIPPPATGCPVGRPSVRVEYTHADPVSSPVSRVHTYTETSCTGALGEGALEAISIVDGMGRARVALSTGDAPGEWIRSGITTHTARGSVRRGYQPDVYTGSTSNVAALLALPSVPYEAAGYDAYSRQVAAWDSGGSLTMTHYHALSTDVCDPRDHSGDIFAGTCTTVRVDGHGRTVDRILRNRDPDTLADSFYRLWMHYRADGSLVHLERAETTGDQSMHASTIVGGRHAERFFVYDSVGRRVASTDPDTDSPLPGRDATNRTWRYLFNRVGDLVAVRDPRGCGQNFFYDHAGRLVGEQYVSCGEAQSHELAVDDVPAGLIAMDETTSVEPVDVRHYFDSYADTWAPDPSLLQDYPATTTGVLGRLTASVDRATRMVTAYDARGQAVWSARQLAFVPAAPPVATSLSSLSVDTSDGTASSVAFDEDETYVVSTSYDHAGRGTAIVLPTDPSSGMRVAGTMAFNHRGLPSSANAHVVDGGGAPSFIDGLMTIPGASIATQPVVSAIQYLRDGLVSATTYGDGTLTQSTYDSRRRPTRMWTTRTPTAPSDPSAPLGAVTVVADQELVWDDASNLLRVNDDRIAAEWPAGHRPQSVWAKHDALYRVVGVEMDYGGGTDTATDWRDGMAATYANDPMRTNPAPMLSTAPTDRVMSLTYQVDWLGNVRDWTDDAHQFYERSLGAISNGADTDASLRPSALYLAADLGGPPSDRGGWVEMDYGESGNLVMMTVHASCADTTSTCVDPGGSLAARRSALSANCSCAEEQHYQYRWDELNRLAEARRYDRSGGTGSWQLEARQRCRYDEANQRRVKQTIDTAGDRITLNVVPGDMERRGVVRGLTGYEDDAGYESETQYLVAGARMVWKSGTPTPGIDRNHRITVNVSDLIGTTSAVIDLVSGELIEHGTYYPNGARETYRSSGDVAPEPTGFTGKEGDEEVGLTYFGERYLVPRIGRWASPDPLAIHEAGGGEALNSYHYVGGNLLQARDPLGLSPHVAPPVYAPPPGGPTLPPSMIEFPGAPSPPGGVQAPPATPPGNVSLPGPPTPPLAEAPAPPGVVSTVVRVVGTAAFFILAPILLASDAPADYQDLPRHSRNNRNEQYQRDVFVGPEQYAEPEELRDPIDPDPDPPAFRNQAYQDAWNDILRDPDLSSGDLWQGGRGVLYWVPPEHINPAPDADGNVRDVVGGYIGTTDDLNARIRNQRDGRDRRFAIQIGSYPLGDENKSLRKWVEQRAFDLFGGIENLDNLRDEISGGVGNAPPPGCQRGEVGP